jgi:hypothetical protein
MSPAKKRQTMGKITRERERKEKRALKQEKKHERKQAAADAAMAADDPTVEQPVDADPADDSA